MMNEEQRKRLIPAIIPHYHFPASSSQVGLDIMDKARVVALVGGYGTSKTSLVEQLAAHVEQPLIRLNSMMDFADIMGHYIARKGEIEWVDGFLPCAMREGFWLLVENIEELPLIAGWIAFYNENGHIILKEKNGEVVEPHKNFRLFVTAHEVKPWMHNLRLHLTDYLPPLQEFRILMKSTRLRDHEKRRAEDMAKVFVSIANETRHAKKEGGMFQAISLRDLMQWVDRTLEIITLDADRNTLLVKAAEQSFMTKMCPEDILFLKALIQRYTKSA